MIITLIITFLKEAPSNNFFRLFLKRAGQSKVGEGALGKCFRTNSRSTNLKKILTNYIFTWRIQSIIDFSGYEPLLNVKLLNFLSLYISKKKTKTFKSIPTSLFRKYTRLVTGTYHSLPKVQIKNKTVKTAQKMKFSIIDFFRIIRIWSHVLKKPLMEKFIFCADQFGEACSKPFQTSEIELSRKIAIG